jgi:hypothetical protein
MRFVDEGESSREGNKSATQASEGTCKTKVRSEEEGVEGY